MERELINKQKQNELADEQARRKGSHAVRRCCGDAVTRGTMMNFARACLAAAALLCFASDHAAAQTQYSVIDTENGTFTDVYVNGQPMRLDHVQQFEERCNITIPAGRWWVNPRTGSLGPEGEAATYNISTCEIVKPAKRECTFFSSGWICPTN